MRMRVLAGVCLAAWVSVAVLAGPAVAGPPPYPKAKGFVLDLAGEIADADEARLEGDLVDYEGRSGNEVAVLIVSTLDGQSVEEYATGVFNAWGIGKKGTDNGVLLLIAMEERTLRLEVGRGLADVLNDEEAALILDDEVTPRLRDDDVLGAVEAGLTAVYGHLDAAGQVADKDVYDDAPPPSYGDNPYDGAPSGGFGSGDGGFDSEDGGFGLAVGLMFLLAPIAIVISLIARASGAGGSGISNSPRHASPWLWNSSERSSTGHGFGGGWSSGGSSHDSGSSGSGFGGGGSSGGDFGGGGSSGGGASGGW